jgi:tRNA(Ile)-lysidine synthetase-like protein
MLVYRHSNIRENLLFVMTECWKISPLPIKFIKATFTRANFKEQLEYYKNDPHNFDKSILDNNPLIEISKTKLYNIGEFDNIDDKTIIISLSGGVDSVVCLFNIIHKHPTKKIIAIHINYNNREEVEEEVKFLRCLCCELKVELYVRKINEIKRNICMSNDLRDIYESYTKKVRFNSYKSIEYGKIPIIILGHNKDDCFENILTNISYNCKYENLIGVEYKSQIDNIIFIRPLINVSKDAIYKFANEHNLPYLKNSTPNWSQRGKIRTDIVPTLNKWDSRIITGLFNLSDIMRDYNDILKNTIENFKETEIEKIEKLNMCKLYWKHGIFKLFNIYISNKSLETLIQRLELWKSKYDSIDVNKKTYIIVSKFIQIMIIKKNDKKYELNIIKKCQ